MLSFSLQNRRHVAGLGRLVGFARLGRLGRLGLLACAATGCASPAFAASLDGAAMALPWALPFGAILLAIATGPLFYAHVWEHHHGKIAAACAGVVILALVAFAGLPATVHAVAHTMLLEYLSFIVLLFSLFTIAGGILVTGEIKGSPTTNSAILVLGTALASIIGTTGASMILIRPIIRANAGRRHKVHVVVFFIFLVSNIGGALTPLGDPPLFVGFLKGVDFFWTTRSLWPMTLFVAGLVLAAFFALDLYLFGKEGRSLPDAAAASRIGIKGGANILLLGGVIGAILMSANWRPGIAIPFPGGEMELQNLLRDAILVALALMSLTITPKALHEANGFSWEPIKEVAKLFAAIFICIVPVVAMLQAGREGALAPIIHAVSLPNGAPDNMMYFWLTGLLSSVLDNAPTYLVFFELAGGDAKTLMGPLAPTLAAISTGAVFMGALTYLGNAPNFMVYAIARAHGVAMPSFLAYAALAFAFLLPVFALTSMLFIR